MKRITEEYSDGEQWNVYKIENEYCYTYHDNLKPNGNQVLFCSECKKNFKLCESITYLNSSPDWTWPQLVGREYVSFHCPICEEVCCQHLNMMS